MKKVLWIHSDFYRPSSNATANRIFSFSNYFSANGYKINIITIGNKTYIDERKEATVFYLKNSFHFKKKNLVNRLLDNIVFSCKTKWLLKKHKKDIHDSFFIVSIPEFISGFSCIAAKKYGATLIVDVRDIWPEVAIEMNVFKQNSLSSKIFRTIAKMYYTKCDFLITVSQSKVAHLCDITHHKFDDKIFWIGNGFDLDTLTLESDTTILSSLNLSNKFVVSYVGNVGKAQHLISLIDFAKTVPDSDYCFLVGGTGSDEEFLKKYVLDGNIKNVFFLGPVSKEQAKAIIEASHLSYVPLSSDKMIDSVPTKLFDSLGLGIPVLLVANGESCLILEKTKLGKSLLPSKISELPDCFNEIRNEYNNIIGHTDESRLIIHNNYSRQKYCADLEKILEKRLSNEKR